MTTKSEARILLLDIETAPAEVYSWGVYDQQIHFDQIIHHPYLLCWSAKWLHHKQILSDHLMNYSETFSINKRDDSKICQSIWSLMNQADLIIAHNGDEFDLKKINSFFLKNKMTPVAGYKSIDTVKQLRKNFGFLSNKLDSICQELKIGQKVKHEGFHLWPKCMNGDHKAFSKMIKYNKKDVLLLEELYLTIRPYMKNHPNLNMYKEGGSEIVCPICHSDNYMNNGFSYSTNGKYRRYKCRQCGSNYQERKNVLPIHKIK